MNCREIKICYYLFSKKEVTLSDLSRQFDKSERTIRYDIEEINFLLKKHNLGEIDIGNKVVFNENFARINELLSNLGYDEYFLDSTERENVILIYGFVKNKIFTIKELSNFMFASRSTVVSDFGRIKKAIKKYNFEMTTEPSLGTCFSSMENDNRREIISNIIRYDIHNVERLFNQKNMYITLSNKKFSGKEYIENISEIISMAEKSSDIILTKYSFNFLKYFIAIYLPNSITSSPKSYLIENDFLKRIVEIICEKFNYSLDSKSIDDIDLIIYRLNLIKKTYPSKDKLKAQIVTAKFIKKISEELEIDLTEDRKLLESLSNHISDIIDNPIVKISEENSVFSVTDKFSDAKKIVKNYIYIIKKFMGRDLNERETDFIVIYIISSIERMKNEIKKIEILLVCANGMGTSLLLSENMKKIIPNCNVSITNANSYENILRMDMPDLVVSTIKLKPYVDYLLISPILSQDNIVEIIERVDKAKIKILKKANSRKPNLEININKNENKKFSLSELLPLNRIKSEVIAKDWREAIRLSGEILVSDACVKPIYINAMQENISRYGPYIIISDGIALPHASSEFGVKKTSMSLIKLKSPVRFDNSSMDVIFFICLASINNEHFDALNILLNALRNKEINKRFFKAENKNKLYELIKEIDSSYHI